MVQTTRALDDTLTETKMLIMDEVRRAREKPSTDREGERDRLGTTSSHLC